MQHVCLRSAFESGVMYFPTAVPFAFAVLVAVPIRTMIGYYTPVMVTGTVLMVIATGLYTTFSPITLPPEWIAYQILLVSGWALPSSCDIVPG